MEIFKRYWKVCLKIIMSLQIIIAVAFIIRNITYVPLYGDTVEYLEISQTMELDNYRPFIYPLLLRGCTELSNLIHINYTYIIYTIQNILSIIMCIVIMSEILKNEDKKTKLLSGLYLWSMPLNIHFNMSVRYDSIAVSFTILFLTLLIKYIRENNWKNWIITSIIMYIASNIRSEKIYFFIFVMVVIIIWKIIEIIKNKEKTKKILIGLIGMLLIVTTSTKITQMLLQKNSDSRAQPSFVMFLYERIVGGYLEQYYDKLPDNVKQSITLEDAKEASTIENNYKIVYQKLYEEDGNYGRIFEVMKTMIRYNHYNIIRNVFVDFNKNMFPVIYLQFCNKEGTLTYTMTRMEGDHPLYADWYDLYATFVFYILLIVCIYYLQKYKVDKNKIIKYIPYILYSFISSVFFACLTSQNFHVRYLIPIYMIEVAIVISIIYQKRENKNECEEK